MHCIIKTKRKSKIIMLEIFNTLKKLNLWFISLLPATAGNWLFTKLASGIGEQPTDEETGKTPLSWWLKAIFYLLIVPGGIVFVAWWAYKKYFKKARRRKRRRTAVKRTYTRRKSTAGRGKGSDYMKRKMARLRRMRKKK